MPSGYLVTLGDGYLDPGDAISGGLITFTTDVDLGDGQWSWSGTWNGSTFTNEVEPGEYHLATDGNIYFIPAFGPVDTLTSAQVISFTLVGDGTIEGTDGDDVIDTDYADPDGDQVDLGSITGPDGADDFIRAGDGDDDISAGIGDDTVYGDGGADTIDGGDGDDTIYGGTDGVTSTTEALDWTDQGGNTTNIAGGFTQNTGTMNVTVDLTSTGNNNPLFQVDTDDANYVGGGEPFDTNSSAYLFGNGDSDTAQVEITFDADPLSGMQDEVQDVAFRINDIDWGTGNHRDIVEVNAYDADGNAVTVTITLGGGDTLSGNTITANDVGEDPSDLGGSALIEIAGPVSRITIDYANGLSGTQAVWITDVYFDTIPQVDGADSISGGDGADTIFGEDGNDTIAGGIGSDSLVGGAGDDAIEAALNDNISGGEGDDYITLTDLGETGAGGISIDGGEGGESGGDTLDLAGLADRDTFSYSVNNPGTQISGTVELLDGTLVKFDNIENIVCFTPGTGILTPRGERPVESLRRGDLVVTADAGPQPIRWIGRRTVPATGAFAPVEIDAARLPGAHTSLLLSPQHRVLLGGWECEMLFGEDEVFAAADHLTQAEGARRRPGGTVTYLHIMFDSHQVVFANGAPVESFFAADQSFAGLADDSREEMLTLFPMLRSQVSAFGPLVRRALKRHEVHTLVDRLPLQAERASGVARPELQALTA